MSERSSLRYALLVLVLVLVLGAVALLQQTPSRSKVVPAAPVASQGLESLRELDKQAPAPRSLNIQTWQTAEGAKVMFVEAHELPMFDLQLTFAAGSSRDGDVHGLAMLTNAMLNEGIPGKDVGQIAAGFEDLGAEFGNGSYRDMAIASLRSLSAPEQREPAVKLFSQVLGQPSFPEDSLLRIKNQLLAGFEFDKQNPGKIAGRALFTRLYGEHPYAHSSDGNPQSITAITREQLQAFHTKAYAAGNAVIALVGDLSRADAETLAAQISSALPKGPALPATVQPQAPTPGEEHIEFASKQTHLMIAELGIDRMDPDNAALYLGNQIFGGGGFGTRLMTEVREKRGLTYGVYSGFSTMQAKGPFTISLQTRAELSSGTLQLVKDQLAEFIKNGPTEAEINDAKREIAGSYPLSTANNSAIVSQLGSMAFYGLPLTYLEDFMAQIQTLNAEQVKAAMAKHLDPNALVVVSVGPSVAQQPLPAPLERPIQEPSAVPEH